MPVVLYIFCVEMGVNGPTRVSILSELPGVQVIDRSSMNAPAGGFDKKTQAGDAEGVLHQLKYRPSRPGHA
jgi:hypothetical protein